MPTMIEEEVSVEKELDEKPDKMKRLPRGSFKPKKGATNLGNCKVKVSMYLDADILDYFRQRAESPNAAPYQTQINHELRRVMENDSRESRSIESDILNNEEFLRALKAKLENLQINETTQNNVSRIFSGKESLDNFENNWSKWQPMPEPENCRNIIGPVKSGVYQIRNKKSNELILFGIGKECQERMRSLYPKPYGKGTRNNINKSNYIFKNWKKLEYRTMETDTKEKAKQIEDALKALNNHLFNT